MGKRHLTEWEWSHYSPVMKLHPSIQSLVDEIDAFRKRNDINATAFGLAAVNDGKFVGDLLKGRIPSLVTIDKVRAFMRDRETVAA
jgi:hypothetical protein